MIAIYHNSESSPYTLYYLQDVKTDTSEAFLKAIEEQEYPMPTSDIIFLDEHGKLCNQFFLHKDFE